MATDVIISAFASKREAQPVEQLRDAPKLIGVGGIGSDQYQASFDTARKPREPWGGKPFSREAERYRNKGGGSILKGLIRAMAPTIEPRRIALVGFSAGNTFLSQILKNEEDAALVDVVLAIDGMTYSKDWKGNPVGFDHWVRFGMRAAGVNRMASASNPYGGPLMVVSHTDIVSGAPSKASSTGDAAAHLLRQVNGPYWDAANHVSQDVLAAQGAKQQQVLQRLRAASRQIPSPLRIRGGNPPTTKTWAQPPYPVDQGYLGNLWTLRWGGTGGPDHILQSNQVQKMLWETYLVPRWNSRNEDVAGLGGGLGGGGGPVAHRLAGVDWTTPDATQPGGGIVQPGTLGGRWGFFLMLAGVGAAGLWGGKKLMETLQS